MARFWTTNLRKKVIKKRRERREQLGQLLAFANADLAQAESSTRRHYVDFLDSAAKSFMNKSPSAGMPEKVDPLKKLQAHLRKRLSEIIDTSTHMVDMPLWTVHGALEVEIKPGGGRFDQKLRLHEIPHRGEINTLKMLIDWVLIKIALELDLEPNRFRQCPRCGIFFYQPTGKDRVYCSTRCGNAVRLQKFRRGKGGQGKST